MKKLLHMMKTFSAVTGSAIARLLGGVVGGALMLSLGGCSALGGGSEMDWDAVQSEIEAGVLKQADLTVTVDCSARPNLKQGDTVHCIMNVPGEKSPSFVTVRAEDDEGAYTWQVDD